LDLWIGRDAVDSKTRGAPEHKMEEQIRCQFRIFHPDLAAGSKFLKDACDGPDRTKPTFFVCDLDEARKLSGLRRQNALERAGFRL